MRDHPSPPVEDVVREINSRVASVGDTLNELTARFIVHRGTRFDETPVDPANLDELAVELEPGCLAVLADVQLSAISGIGLVWTADDDASGMLWWRADNGKIARKHHVFNPDSDSFYDYRKSIWYQGALSAEGLVVVGPYIDAWGTDDHALTASVRMGETDRLLGVAAVDLDVNVLTAQFDKLLASQPDTVLLNAEDRVITSNVALLSPGLRIAPFLNRTGRTVTERYDTAIMGWELVRLG